MYFNVTVMLHVLAIVITVSYAKLQNVNPKLSNICTVVK